jgi:hypothetical protein
LALYLPWSILTGALPAALSLIRRLLPDLSLPGSPALALAVYLPALLVSAAVTLYLEFLDPKTSHGGAHVRGAALACIAAYLFSSILSIPALSIPAVPPDSSMATRVFLPSLGSVSAVLASLYLWVFVIYLRDLFRAREFFESHTRRFRGDDLRRVILEDSDMMSAAEARSVSVIRSYGIQLGAVLVLTLLCALLKAPLSLFQRVLVMAIIAGAAVIFSLLNLFRQEQFFAGEGIAASGPERGKRLGAAVIFCAAAALLAALCASDSNLLPISILRALLAALARLFSRPRRPVEIPPEPPPRQTPPAMGGQDLARLLGVEESEPWPFWDYLPYIALALAIAAFLWFLVKPLFSLNRGSGKLPFLLRLVRLFKGGFTGLRRALGDFFRSLRRGGAQIRIPEGDLKDLTGELMAAWSRKGELRQSLNLFARLILWGERQYHTAWKPSMGPGEFCALLASAQSASEPAAAVGAEGETGKDSGNPARQILRCGEIFEEALYGPRPPDKETQREFKALVEAIVRA